jgi:hypothetical protein
MKGAPGVKVVVVVTSSGGKGKGERGGEKREERRVRIVHRALGGLRVAQLGMCR